MTALKKTPHPSPGFADDDARWDAVVRRDRTADGAFVFSVRTTGVYCRPSCGARRALRKNVRFHASGAEAERAGFRPCKRCRPHERALDDRRASAVARACRLIETSEEPPSLETLAESAGLSRFHFHRVFKALTGVTPKAYADAQRAQKVREELGRTATVTEAVYGAGFPSSGRFYATAAELLGMTPTAFRAGGEGASIRVAVSACWLGKILVAATDQGVCAVLLGDDPDDLVRDLQGRFPKARLIGGDADFDRLVARVVGCVETPSRSVELPLDIRGTAFQRQVWEALRAIPAGSTASYTEIAQRIGQPAAVRAVARACASNPIAVAIPCHRVVRTDGSLSGYRWGVERKAKLLGRERALAVAVDSVSLALPYTPPLDWLLLLRHLQGRATAGVEQVYDGVYMRSVEVAGDTGLLTVSHHPTESRLEVTIRGAAARHAPELAERVRAVFDLDADLASVHAVLGADPWLAPAIRAFPGLRVPGAWSPFELIARTIVGQQVTVKAATTIMGRLANRLGRPIPGVPDGEPSLLFPLPRAIADGDLEAIGMPSQRVAALRGVARAFAEESIPFAESKGCTDGTKAALLALPGIGPWTVEYFALRALRDTDAWPASDLVLRRALAECAPSLSPAAVLARTERWRPWRAYAAMHLWNRVSQARAIR
ncbi:MAG: bifunctional DNA-binding transcriptional regulator/O6-methylguanine-DNA methyltransferase Ada [Isosphaeraceae bacterium]|nr:bifunctional DNA-binding transcriptional regulator/O6-methylguanine-DNA methyltransferase Ada [Isosphaeraceae bacterium]